MAARFDVVVFGPTGVTGREVARHISRRAAERGLRWAVAGRDRKRVNDALAVVDAEPDDVLLADTSDPASISQMVARARVVANLVGPYARYGEVVHAACAAGGEHELDLTGEIAWVRTMIDRYDEVAVATGAAIVPSAGFESLPFDVAARLAARAAAAGDGSPVVDVDAAVAITTTARVTRASDAVSGGTFTSMVDMIRHGDAATMTDPDALDPERRHRRRPYDLRPRRHAGTGAWLSPLLPTPYLNPPVVHRTAALSRARGEAVFAPTFRYREGSVVASMLPAGSLPGADVAVATMAAAGMSTMGMAARAPGPLREGVADLMARFGPKPGDGPRPETLDAWRYRLDVRATTERGGTADVVLEAVGHPGYKSTATIVGEAALAVAENPPSAGGYLTPSSALDLDDLDRFAEAGMRVTVVGAPGS